VNDIQKASKNFFQRPEGKTGMFFIAAMMVLGAWGLSLILPFLITLVANTLYLGLLCAALVAFVMIVSDKRFQNLLAYGFKSVMRAITGLMIEIDPIGMLRNYADGLRGRLEDMRNSLDSLEGQKRKLKGIIEKNERNRVDSLNKSKVAHEQKARPAFILQSRQAGRLEKSNLTLQSLLNKMEALSKVLRKMYETSEFLIMDIEGEIEVKSSERAAILASHSAYKSAKAIIQGDRDQKAIFDQTMEFLADDYAMKIGEIESFMDMSQGFIQSVDLENGVYEQSALDQFEAWEKKADSLLLGPGDKNPLHAIDATPRRTPVGVVSRTTSTEGSGSFSDLFDKD
jgi:hypothetical protein